MDVSSEAIEFRDDQGCLGLLSAGDGSRQLGTIGPPAALNLKEFAN
jgi:hypothetical protein